MKQLTAALAAAAAVIGVLAAQPVHAASDPIVTMVTNRGTIIIKLFPEDAPLTCANFVNLVKQGFYNGHKFFRVDPHPDKLIQGGSSNDKNTGTSPVHVKGEFPSNGVQNPLTHVAGAVAMARASDPNSAGTQFYICVDPEHRLDGDYCVFGQVIKGLDVADKLEVGDKMTKVTVTE